MELRNLGGDGPALSAVGLGCNNFGMKLDREASIAVVHAALDAGVTHLDTAEMYGGGRSEEYIGEALVGRRDEALLATKFLPRPADEPYTPGILAKRIREACETSLRRLRTDRIDLYYQHYPDAEAPVDEALETLGELVREGKVLHLASSNVSAAQIGAAAACSEAKRLARFVGTQLEWSLVARAAEESVIPAARTANVGIVPYFPLASGLLTGKYRRGEAFPEGTRFAMSDRFARFASDANFDRLERLQAFAAAHGRSIIELAIGWLLAQEGVASVISGATTPEQVRANAAAGQWAMTADELAAVPF
jgi:aryl-alcohol dehydrogenase-like predicted oxidoreductase